MESINCAREYETPQNLNFTKLDFYDLDYMEICKKKKKKKNNNNNKKRVVVRAINILKTFQAMVSSKGV